MSSVWDDDRWDPNRMMDGGTMYGGAWLMVLLTLLVIAALVATVVVVLRASRSGGSSPGLPAGTGGPGDRPEVGSPRDLLDQRLARGEITPEEYRATRALLSE